MQTRSRATRYSTHQDLLHTVYKEMRRTCPICDQNFSMYVWVNPNARDDSESDRQYREGLFMGHMGEFCTECYRLDLIARGLSKFTTLFNRFVATKLHYSREVKEFK